MAWLPGSPSSHNFRLALRDQGINHARDAIRSNLVFLVDAAFFMQNWSFRVILMAGTVGKHAPGVRLCWRI
jgi:hypothetical protein